MMFLDRTDAGRRLAAKLEHLRGQPVVVLGLPRGGVPVAYEVATALHAPLDVIVVRKLGVPFQPELGMGAIGEDGARVINDDIVQLAHVSADELRSVEARERIELERRASRFRGDRPRQSLEGRIAIIVDDGIATGSTARAACHVARAHGAARVVLAVPVAPSDWQERFEADADELICLAAPAAFQSVGQFYLDFAQTTDDQVMACLERSASPSPDDDADLDVDVEVEVAGPVVLEGHLTVPARPLGLVLFAHGSGSSRHSPRNQFVASTLHQAGLGTLLFDLLTPEEEEHRSNVFDIELLGGRLADATRWLRAQPGMDRLPIGYFGASTGAAAALWASTEPDIEVAAVVSRGGRPDLAHERLALVTAPTLLIVGGNDPTVLDLNRDARAHMTCTTNIVIVSGATHLFGEPGTLATAAHIARDWFVEHCAG